MKKVFFIAAASLLVLASCSKTRTCKCANGYNYPTVGTKDKAQTTCDNYASADGTTCTLED